MHLEERGHKTAVTFVGEPGDVRHVSYRELHADVCRFANALLAQGVKTGDRVVIYMPMTPEAIVAMHACARIGAIHSVVFGGFSALSLQGPHRGRRGGRAHHRRWRLARRQGRRAQGSRRQGAVARVARASASVIVLKRTGQDVPMKAGRDLWWHDVIEGQPPVCEPVWVDAEHPLFLLYTSGSTGKPKGIQHSSAGYLLGAKLTSKWVFDLNDDDVFWCTADIGWVTGHSYVAYGPLAAGATIVIYEGAPTTPHPGRFWQICESQGVTIFYTAPTAIRALMKLGDDIPARYDLTKLRLLGSVGEPINPEAWMWYHETRRAHALPDRRHVVADGNRRHHDFAAARHHRHQAGFVHAAAARHRRDHRRCARRARCRAPTPADTSSIRKPWPSMLRTIWGDNERYLKTYWETFQNRYYVAGDSAHRDKDGYFWIMGRIDDVLNVAGHRLGTMEIESALVAHPKVAEAAVVGKQHEIKGESVFAFVVLRGERPTGDKVEAFAKTLRDWVTEQLGAIARPDDILFAENLPKTRSGKIMRRLLRAIARNEDITQDLSTLENPAIIDQLRGGETPKKTPAAPTAPKKTAPKKKAAAKTKRVPAKAAPARKAAPKKKAAREEEARA